MARSSVRGITRIEGLSILPAERVQAVDAATSGADPAPSGAGGERRRIASRRLHGCLGLVVGLALTMLTAMLLGRSWNACDIGVNNAANSGFLTFLFIPGFFVLLLLVWVAVGVLAGHRPLLHAFVLAVALLAVVWCVVSVFWDNTPTPWCPRGVPPWWPGFIPAPGF